LQGLPVGTQAQVSRPAFCRVRIRLVISASFAIRAHSPTPARVRAGTEMQQESSVREG
jgi:hypothetical protein